MHQILDALIQKRVFTLISILFVAFGLYGQKQNAVIKGRVVDAGNNPFEEANIVVLGTSIGTVANKDGYFELSVPANRPIALEISHIEMSIDKLYQLSALRPNEVKEIKIEAQRGVHLAPIDFEATRGTKGNTFVVIEPDKLEIPNPSGGIETAIKLLAGVNSSNELSSQYSVRGGSFDENLVYINGIEIYRPFFNRSGQSEGLSIINPNMVQSLAFSAGGFSAYYGDKLSSVLDITYKKPTENAVILQGSFLGGSAHVEGMTKNYRLNYMFSTRYWSNRYLLNSLDVQGNYNPTFSDFQSFVTYRLTDKASLSWLGYFGGNRYLNIPETQTTKFGTIRDAKQLTVYYRGQELIEYQTYLNALQLEIKPHDSLYLNFSSTIYRADESERFDVLGQYFLSQLDNEIGSETFGDPKYVLGVGSYLNHARNFLLATIINVQHRGDYSTGNHKISWGGVYQQELIDDELKEWRYLDSAGYAVPRGNPRTIDMSELIVSNINLNNNRASAYVQDEWVLNEATNTKLNLGVRANYYSYSGQFLVAPRLSFSFEPNRDHNANALLLGQDKDSLKRNIRIKAALGLYQQPPLYRELRTKTGSIVENIRAQQSLHAVVGADWNFELWNRDKPFKFSGELYYKYMWDLIPYEIENVRIRYLPEFTAEGYAVGADFHVNGEFIPDLPSWFSFSLMSTRENIDGDTYVDLDGETQEVGWIARPTDQRYSFNILFQDFLKNNETYRVHLNLVFAHGLPYGPPGYAQWRNALRVAPYRRVDIGFSKVLFDKEKSVVASSLVNKAQKVSLGVDIFNLFGIRNTISYLWVTDVTNNQFAVPSYLTGRRFNLNLTIKL